jgi:hypothetical protein
VSDVPLWLSATLMLAVVVAAVVVWRAVPSLRAWPPSLGLMLACGTIIPSHDTLGFGVGTDDVPLLLGLAVLLICLIRPARIRSAAARSEFGRPELAGRTLPFARLALVGAALLASGMVVAAFVNNEQLEPTISMLIRGAGRVVLYVVVVLVILAQRPLARVRRVVAAALVVVACVQSVVSLVSYTVGLPGDFGLEPARGGSGLLGEIPGRATGTLGLSSNFLGALLVLTIPVTLGLALRHAGRLRWLLVAAAVAQLVTMVLTYTRASLAVTVAACLLLLALRGRLRWLIGGVVLLVVLVVATPALHRVADTSTDRLALYTSAIKVFADHPIAGVGPGEQANVTAAAPARYRGTDFGVAANNAHNTVLLAAAEDGVLGAAGAVLLNVAIIGVAVAVLRAARRIRGQPDADQARAIGVAVLAFLAQGMTNNLFTVTLTATALVLLLAGCAWPWLARSGDGHVVEPTEGVQPSMTAPGGRLRLRP